MKKSLLITALVLAFIYSIGGIYFYFFDDNVKPKAVKNISEMIENLKMNTGVSEIMVFVKHLQKESETDFKELAEKLKLKIAAKLMEEEEEEKKKEKKYIDSDEETVEPKEEVLTEDK